MHMDKGFLLALYGVISGWFLIVISLIFIKLLLLTLSGEGLLVALLRVVLGLLILLTFLYAWYGILRRNFLKIKMNSNGPGGT